MPNTTATPSNSFWKPTSSKGFLFVLLGAGLWGTDAIFRKGLATKVPTSVVVWVEQLIPLLCLLPYALRGTRRAIATFKAKDWIFLIMIGCGASTVATYLYTRAFTYGIYTTPVLLQQVQPLFAIVGARILLRERLHPRFGFFVIAALIGSYFIAFAQPSAPSFHLLAPALLTLSAAGIWGLGTVFGRSLGAKVPFNELTALRVLFGLFAATILVAVQHDFGFLAHLSGSSDRALLLMSLFPGLFALLLYYTGLRATPASVATLAELAFPITALLVNYFDFNINLSNWQWMGVAILIGTITTMGLDRREESLAGVDVELLPVG